jgi:hypothetical protein
MVPKGGLTMRGARGAVVVIDDVVAAAAIADGAGGLIL